MANFSATKTDNTTDLDIDAAADALIKADKNLKKWEKSKKTARSDFFDALSDLVEQESFYDTQTVELNKDTWQTEVEKNYPTWEVVTLESNGEDPTVFATLREKPEYVKHSYIYDGMKISRQVAMVGASFDLETFIKDHPLMAEQFVHVVRTQKFGLGRDFTNVVEESITYQLNEPALEEFLNNHPDTLATIQEYMSPGKPQIRLGSIVKAKADEV